MAPLSDLQFSHRMTRSGLHQVLAKQGGRVVGGLQWHPDADPALGITKGEIGTVAVLPSHQKRGIASAMLDHARGLSGGDIPPPKASTSMSPAGTGWTAKAFGSVPPNREPQREFSPGSTRDLVRMMARS